MFRFWDCAIAGCPNAAAVDVGGCERCRSMYCAPHVASPAHPCELKPLDDDAWMAAQEAELVGLRAKTNHAALLMRAKDLSGGVDCRLDDEDHLGRRLMGGMHVHLQIVFENGMIWLARLLRETYTSFDDELSNQILLSECATLRWLESINIPTPRLYGYGLRGDPANDVGVAYMLIEKLPGRPYNSYAASKEQRSKVLDQWAGIMCTLGSHPFDSLGSLSFNPQGVIQVGPIASDRTGTLPPIGPFEDARELYQAWANAYLELISDGQLFSSYPFDAWLMFKFLVQQAKEGPWFNKWQSLNAGPFFLKHTDDKGDHILVDDDFQITGIIDWTFARVVPAYEAFGPSLVSADTNSLFGGKMGLSEEDLMLDQHLQHRKAPFNHFESDTMRRYLFGLGMGLGLSKHEIVDAFECIVGTLGAVLPALEEWRRQSEKQWSNDPLFIKLHGKAAGGRPNDPTILKIQSPAIPRFATCSIIGCERPSVRGRSCSTCSKHLCAVHILSKYHKCPSSSQLDDEAWEMGINNEVDTLLKQINVPELVKIAGSLRDGKSCKFTQGKHLGSGAIMGCANYHAWILFEDGVKWLARIPRTTAFSDIPLELVDYLLKSEYATLKWLEDIPIPTPRVHGFSLFSDPTNRVGVGYILEDAMGGTPFYAHKATAAQKAHVISQYADILSTISHHPRNLACSLTLINGEIKEDAVASNRFLTLGIHGPFATSTQYFTSLATLHLELIADGQLYPEYPKESFLFFNLLKNRVAPILASAPNDIFFLKHVDDKGDHLLVDDNYNIVGVIDWQFARFAPACEAFGPSLFTADLGKLYSGLTGLSADDQILSENLKQKVKAELTSFGDHSEIARRFQFGLASGLVKSEVLGMIKAILSLLGDLEACSGSLEQWVEDEWRQAVGDPLHEKVELLVADLDRERSE